MLLATQHALVMHFFFFFFFVFFACRTLLKPLHTHKHKVQLTCTYFSLSVFGNLSPLFLSPFPHVEGTPLSFCTWALKSWNLKTQDKFLWALLLTTDVLGILYLCCYRIYISGVIQMLCRISGRMRLLQEAPVRWGQVHSRKQDGICWLWCRIMWTCRNILISLPGLGTASPCATAGKFSSHISISKHLPTIKLTKHKNEGDTLKLNWKARK